MRTVNVFVDTESPITSKHLDRVERDLEIALPSEFRSHYLRHNGGSPVNCIFQCDNEEFVVQEFFPINNGEEGDRLEDVCRAIRNDRKLIPHYLVPFADDPGGDFFCFSIKQDEFGSIYHVCIDLAEEPDRAVRWLSYSLTHFIQSLKKED